MTRLCAGALVGVAVILGLSLRLVRPDVRPMLIGFGIGTIAVATAVFFVNLYSPWLYYWSYAGIVMRLAANALEPTMPAAEAVPAGMDPRLAQPVDDD